MSILLNNERLEIDMESAHFQTLLAEAHRSGIHPLCLCAEITEPDAARAPLLHIARINDRYWLKRNPNTGEFHVPECEHFAINPLLSGRGTLESRAIIEHPDTGMLTLKLGVSLSVDRNPGEALESDAACQNATSPTAHALTKVASPRVSLAGLRDLLLEEAGLTRWYPKMQGKRFYGVVGRQLQEAANRLRTTRQALGEFILVPQYSKDGGAGENDMRYGALVNRLDMHTKRVPVGFVMGELRRIDLERNTPMLTLQHMTADIALDGALTTHIVKRYGNDMDFALSSEDHHFILLARVYSHRRQLVADNLTGLLLNHQWLEVGRDGIEQRVLDRLESEQRAYQRVMRYGARPEQVLASAVLLDTGTSTPIFVSPASHCLATDTAESAERALSAFEEILRKEAPENALVFSPTHAPSLPKPITLTR